jgi:hypothetical protein
MKNLEKKISEINNYFVEKLQNGDYELIEINNYTVNLSIGGKIFIFWICNFPESFGCYSSGKSFMDLSFTSDMKEILWNRFQKLKKTDSDFARKRFEDYQKLKSEFEHAK